MSTEELLEFLKQSATPYHFLEKAHQILTDKGFTKSNSENFFRFKECSLLAVNKPDPNPIIFTAQCIGPSVRITDISNLTMERVLSPSLRTYFDRDFRLGGKLTIEKEDGTKSSRVFISNTSIAITEYKSNTSPKPGEVGNSIPLRCTYKDASGMLKKLCHDHTYVSSDVFLVDSEPISLLGIDESLICGSGLSAKLGAILTLNAFMKCEKPAVLIITGSTDFSGIARWASSHLQGVKPSLIFNWVPQHSERAKCQDVSTQCFEIRIGDGIGIGFGEKSRNGTDVNGAAQLRAAAERASVTVKNCRMAEKLLSDKTTLGHETKRVIGGSIVDCGIPVLSMNSLRETVSVDDVNAMTAVLEQLIA